MRALLVVLTAPASDEVEPDYNAWYTGEHLPDVLAVPGYVRATRYRSVATARQILQPYLALYELDIADEGELRAVSDEHMRRIREGEMRSTTAIDGESMRALYYAEIDGPAEQDVPQGLGLAFARERPGASVAPPGGSRATLLRMTDVNMLERPWLFVDPWLLVVPLGQPRARAARGHCGGRSRDREQLRARRRRCRGGALRAHLGAGHRPASLLTGALSRAAGLPMILI